MQQGGSPNLVTNLIVPGAIGNHIPATLYVEYANTGNAPMPAPLLILTATRNGVTGAEMTLDPSRRFEARSSLQNLDGYGTTVEFLASGATPGILEPGESVRVPVYYAFWNGSWASTQILFSLSITTVSNRQTINWSSMQSGLEPPSIGQAAWNALFPNVAAAPGSTWGSFVTAMDADSRFLAALGENVTDVSKLFSFAVEQVIGFSPLATLASAMDASLPRRACPSQWCGRWRPQSSPAITSARSDGAGPTRGTRRSS